MSSLSRGPLPSSEAPPSPQGVDLSRNRNLVAATLAPFFSYADAPSTESAATPTVNPTRTASPIAAGIDSAARVGPTVTISKPPPAPKRSTRSKEDVLAGAIAGGVARFIVAPLDMMKIRLQVQTSSGDQRKYRSLISSARTIYAEEGLRAFWKGNLIATCMIAPYSATAFTVNQKLKALAFDSNRTPHPVYSLFSGAAAGAVGVAVTYPLDLLRTRFAAQHGGSGYGSLRTAVGTIFRERGVKGFYDGLRPALVGIVPYMGLQFAIYDAAKTAFTSWHQTTVVSAARRWATPRARVLAYKTGEGDDTAANPRAGIAAVGEAVVRVRDRAAAANAAAVVSVPERTDAVSVWGAGTGPEGEQRPIPETGRGSEGGSRSYTFGAPGVQGSSAKSGSSSGNSSGSNPDASIHLDGSTGSETSALAPEMLSSGSAAAAASASRWSVEGSGRWGSGSGIDVAPRMSNTRVDEELREARRLAALALSGQSTVSRRVLSGDDGVEEDYELVTVDSGINELNTAAVRAAGLSSKGKGKTQGGNGQGVEVIDRVYSDGFGHDTSGEVAITATDAKLAASPLTTATSAATDTDAAAPAPARTRTPVLFSAAVNAGTDAGSSAAALAAEAAAITAHAQLHPDEVPLPAGMDPNSLAGRAFQGLLRGWYGATAYIPAAAGLVAGSMGKFFTFPFDVIKKRYQVEVFPHATAHLVGDKAPGAAADAAARARESISQSMAGCARAIVKAEGVRGLFKGIVPAVLKSGPNAAITFSVYEACIYFMTKTDGIKNKAGDKVKKGTPLH